MSKTALHAAKGRAPRARSSRESQVSALPFTYPEL
jgi:hypothetical protein